MVGKFSNKKVVIFELESTLVSCFGETLSNEENDLSSLGINIRPHLKSSLDLIDSDLKYSVNALIFAFSSSLFHDASI